MPALSLRNLNKKYGNVEVIHDLSLDIEVGEFAVLVGPSGCGKSTLLRMLAGLEEITSGELIIDGKVANDLHPRERGVSMVFQSYALYPHMTVRENIGFGLKLAKTPKAEIRKIVDGVADTLQINELLDRRPSQLSGGQNQRVAIGRALARKPKIILFDEPLSNLDAKLRVKMRTELKDFHRDHGITTVYVTHDQVEAMAMADRITVMESGRVMQTDVPLTLYNQPAGKFVAEFIGSPQMNMLDVTRVEDGQLFTNEIAIPIPSDARKSVANCRYVGIRPQHLDIVKVGKGIATATVKSIEHLGNESFLQLQLGEGLILTSTLTGSTTPELNDRLDINVSWDKLHIFGADGTRIKVLPRVSDVSTYGSK